MQVTQGGMIQISRDLQLKGKQLFPSECIYLKNNHQKFILDTSFVARGEFYLWSGMNTSLLPEHSLIYVGNVWKSLLES